ncbi:MAG: hypothetical protein QM500_12140 [Methylococcales bacterium]
MNTIQKTIRLGTFKERMQIKAFKSADDMHKFLNKQFDNNWQESKHDLKSGTYAFVGGEWCNVKKMNASSLAHV